MEEKNGRVCRVCGKPLVGKQLKFCDDCKHEAYQRNKPQPKGDTGEIEGRKTPGYYSLACEITKMGIEDLIRAIKKEDPVAISDCVTFFKSRRFDGFGSWDGNYIIDRCYREAKTYVLPEERSEL